MSRERTEYYVFWAYGRYRKSEKGRPWVEYVETTDGHRCHPISHEKPTRNVWRYFYLDPKEDGFPVGALDLPSWVDVTESCDIPETEPRRREGFIGGALAMKLSLFLARHAGGRPGRSNPTEIIGEEVYIAPWLYQLRKAPLRRPEECLAARVYDDAKLAAHVPEGACYYDHGTGHIVKGCGVPGPSFWIRAYVDWHWNRRFSRKQKNEWQAIIARPANALTVQRMQYTYAGNVGLDRGLRRLTMEQRAGAILADSAAWWCRYPTDVDSPSMAKYIDTNCRRLLFTLGRGW